MLQLDIESPFGEEVGQKGGDGRFTGAAPNERRVSRVDSSERAGEGDRVGARNTFYFRAFFLAPPFFTGFFAGADFFGAGFLGAGFLAAGFFGAAFFGAGFFAAGFEAAGFDAAGFAAGLCATAWDAFAAGGV